MIFLRHNTLRDIGIFSCIAILCTPLMFALPAHATTKGDTTMPEFYTTPEAKAAKLPFSLAVRVGDVLHLSGALGAVPGTMNLAPGGIEAQTKQTMENIGAVLKANGLSFDDVFKCTVMMADMKEWPAFNAVYVTYFKPDRLPARSAFGANGLALGAAVEMECMAMRQEVKLLLSWFRTENRFTLFS